MHAKRAGNKVILSVSIDADLVHKLQELADAVGRSRSSYVEALLREAVDQESDTIKALQHPVLGPALVSAFRSRDVLKAMAEVIGDELKPEQLHLFREAMNHISGQQISRPQRRAAKAKVRKATKRKNGGQIQGGGV